MPMAMLQKDVYDLGGFLGKIMSNAAKWGAGECGEKLARNFSSYLLENNSGVIKDGGDIILTSKQKNQFLRHVSEVLGRANGNTDLDLIMDAKNASIPPAVQILINSQVAIHLEASKK